jgi:hypoxia up-regulated 1
MPQYTNEGLAEVVATYESINAWFVAKLAEQEALPATADPVLLVAEIQAKSQELTSASMSVIMKAMNVPKGEYGQWGAGGDSSTKSSKTKTKTKTTSSKSKKAKATKSKSSKGPKTTEMDMGNGKGKQNMFKMETEEDINAYLEDMFGPESAEELREKRAEQEKEKEKEQKKEKEHKIDEL